jgi:hypothetical protein
MQESIGLDSIVHSNFGWNRGITGRTADRKAFEQRRDEWALYQQSRSSIPHGGNTHTREHTRPASSLEPWERASRKMGAAVAWKADGKTKDGGRR